MEIVTVVLALLSAVLVGDWINRFVPIPPPLVQIALGIVLSVVPFLPSVELDPEIFFLVFLPPLLFLDGWRIPKRDLRRDGVTILALALGLVVVTVVGIGCFVNWLVPSMPIAVAFALAAVLAPTDPIAVSAVAAQAPVPRRLMHILEAEGLLNDATGLVCLRFAVAAAMTGSFSLPEAGLSFLWLAAGGAAIGVGVTLAITWLEERVLKRGERDPGAHTLFSLLIPFAVYLFAERVHTSGILAAATAGIAMTAVENRGAAPARIRMRRTAVWDTVQLAGNGAIFVLLGEQLPDSVKHAAKSVASGAHGSGWWLAAYVLVIFLALLVLRFAWVAVTMKLFLRRAHKQGEKAPPLTLRLVAATTLAGVKGAITLAGVLTLPQTLPSGAAFPARDLAVALAMGVILVSLASASLALPSLLRRLRFPLESGTEAEEDNAREIAGKAAMKAIERVKGEMLGDESDPDLYDEAAERAMERYSRRRPIHSGNDDERARGRELRDIEHRLRLAGFEAEREALFRLRRGREIEDVMLRRLVREVDLMEARFGGD